MSYLVLSAKRYNFKNDEGEQVAGCTVQYLDLEGGISNEPNRRGFEPLTISSTVEAFDQFSALPGFYALDFKQRPGRNGRPTLALTSAKLERAVSLTAPSA
jgi:hypothetical protein